MGLYLLYDSAFDRLRNGAEINLQGLTKAVVQMASITRAIERNLVSIDRSLGDAAQQSAEIVCFPELSACGCNTSERNGEPAYGAQNLPTVKIHGETSTLAQARRVPETFFRYFRRSEIYDAWRSSG